MTQEKVNEIMSLFPADKPVCFNYQQARDIVLELLQEHQAGRILNIVINLWQDDTCTEETWVMFRVRDDIVNPEETFRAAIAEFCKTDEGSAMVVYAGGSPNWGDIFSCRPDDFFKEKGFFPLYDSVAMVVDHDEIVYTSNVDEE